MALIRHNGFKALSPVVYSNYGTFIADDATPSVSAHNHFVTSPSNTGALTITNFDDGVDGQILIIRGRSVANATTIQDNSNLRLAGDWVEANYKTLTLIKLASSWYELCRSAN